MGNNVNRSRNVPIWRRNFLFSIESGKIFYHSPNNKEWKKKIGMTFLFRSIITLHNLYDKSELKSIEIYIQKKKIRIFYPASIPVLSRDSIYNHRLNNISYIFFFFWYLICGIIKNWFIWTHPASPKLILKSNLGKKSYSLRSDPNDAIDLEAKIIDSISK